MKSLIQNGTRKKPAVLHDESENLQNHKFEDGLVFFLTSSGRRLRGKVIKLGLLTMAFEIYEIKAELQLSEIFGDFKVFLNGREVYFGQAVLSNLLKTPAFTICEVKLDEPGIYVGINMPFNGNINFLDAYKMSFEKWQTNSKLLPEFKLAVLDIESYLLEIKSLMEQIEISILTHPSQNCLESEQQFFRDLAPTFLATVDILREKLLATAENIKPDTHAIHQVFLQRQLHPLFLCSPFAHRTFHKPLGYAGDYEIMNMIHRNTFEGGSLYAKLVHYWLVNQAPAISVRNRVAYLKTKLVQETARTFRGKRTARILNLGCGPAREVQDFISEQVLSNNSEFTLLDFDAETLDHALSRLVEIIKQNARTTKVRVLKTSVTQIVKDSLQSSRNLLGGEFDLIYCGGLFDYLPDKVCKQLVSLLYECLAPSGLMVVANMADNVPYRKMLELLLDWNLIYRDARQLSSFAPAKAIANCWPIRSEPIGANLFLELRKEEPN